MNTEQRLQEAIEDGEVLRVTYAGGSQPGAEREIAPISIKNGKVRARCYASGAVKLFVIDKITILEETARYSPAWDPNHAEAPAYTTLDDVLIKHSEELKGRGWHIQQSEDHIGLHMYGKHRKLLKYPTVSIIYDPEIHELYMGLDGELVQPEGKREKPWVVRAKDQNTNSYKKFEKAALKFLEYARQVTPNPEPAPKTTLKTRK